MVTVEQLERRRLLTTYYLSPTGSDGNPAGDPAHPWATIAKLNTTTFSPGDSILFQVGQSFAGNLVLGPNDLGSTASPIRIDSYSYVPTAPSPVMVGSGSATILAGTGAGIYGSNMAGVSIGDLSVVGSGQTPNTSSGIQFDNNLSGNVQLATIHINGVTVDGFGKYGITIGGSNGKSGFSDVRITDANVYANLVGGIETHGVFSSTATTYANAGVYVGHCVVHDNPGYAGSPSHSGDGIALSDVNGGTIEKCEAYNNGAANTHVGGPVGIWAWDSNGVVIQFDESYANHTNSTADGDGFDLDGGDTNSVMQYNYSHNNDGAGYALFDFSGARPWGNNTVRYNISENDGRKNGYAGIQAWGYSGTAVQNAEVYNNTVYVAPSASAPPLAVFLQTGTVNFHVRDNILQTTGGLTLASISNGTQRGLAFQGNDYWPSGAAFVVRQGTKTYTSLQGWRSATGQETLNGQPVGSSIDPQLADPGHGGTVADIDNLASLSAYKLQLTSPLINSGINLWSNFANNPGPQDFFGDTLPADAASMAAWKYDVGANEAKTPKPVADTPLNGASISSGLILDYPVNEGAGYDRLRDIVGFEDLNPSNLDISGAWSAQNGTMAVRAGGAGASGGELTLKMPATTYTAHTLFWYGIINSTDGNERWLIDQNNDGPAPGNQYGATGLSVKSGNVNFYAGTTSRFHDVFATAAVPAGVPILLTIVASAGDYRFYVNSTKVAGSADPATPFFGGGQELDAFSFNNPFNPNLMPDCYVEQIGVASRAWSNAEVAQVADDPFTFFAPTVAAAPVKATGYTVELKSYSIVNQSYPLIVHPVPYGAAFSAGSTITISSSLGDAPAVIPLSGNGVQATYTPTVPGTKTLAFGNNAGLTNAPSEVMVTRGISGTDPTHTAPAPVPFAPGAPGTWITPISFRSRNIFLTGDPVQFLIPGEYQVQGAAVPVTCTGWVARDFSGNVVDSGTCNITGAQIGTITPNVTTPGWYKLYLYKGSATYPTGDWVGGTTFVITSPDANLISPGYSDPSGIRDFPPDVVPTTLSQSPNTPFTAPAATPELVKMFGTITPPTSGSYQFSTQDNVLTSGVVIKMDEAIVYDKYDPTWPAALAPVLNLTGGVAHTIEVDTWIAEGAAKPNLYWYAPGGGWLIPDSVFNDQRGNPGALTANYYAGYLAGYQSASQSTFLDALTADGMDRFSVNVNTTIDQLLPDLRTEAQYDLGKDPARPRCIDIEFEDFNSAGGSTPASVTALLQSILAQGLGPSSIVCEPCNEPSGRINPATGAYYTPQEFAAVMKAFHDAVKAADPRIGVLGPGNVDIKDDAQPGLQWLGPFLAQLDTSYGSAGAVLDGLSFHLYNSYNGDMNWLRGELAGLKNVLSSNGAGSLPLYQTEQGYTTATYGVYDVKHDVQWTMMQLQVFEQNGIPKEHNYYFYDRSHGYWDYPTWLQNDDGSLNPTALALRVWSRELFGKIYQSPYSFGGNKDNYFIGSLFGDGTNGVAVFQTNGDPDASLAFNVSGASSLQVVSAFGVVSTVAVSGGTVTLPVGDLPVYVRLPAGVGLSLGLDNWGPNLSLSAVASESGGSFSDPALTNNGRYEVDNSRSSDFGPYWSSLTDLNKSDAWLQLTWASTQTIGKVVLHTQPMWGRYGVPLDFEVQYDNGGTWVTLAHPVETLTIVPAYSPNVHCTVDDYSRHTSEWQINFPTVTTNKIRLVVHLATLGGDTSMLTLSQGGQGWGIPAMSVQELETYI